MKKLGTPKAVRNFFDGGNRRGEIGEFKEELNHNSKDRKKEALKKAGHLYIYYMRYIQYIYNIYI